MAVVGVPEFDKRLRTFTELTSTLVRVLSQVQSSRLQLRTRRSALNVTRKAMGLKMLPPLGPVRLFRQDMHLGIPRVRPLYPVRRQRRGARDPLRISVTEHDDSVWLSARGEIDLTNADEFKFRLEAAAIDGQPLVIDLSLTEYLDSPALSILRGFHVGCRDRGQQVVLITPPAIWRLIRLFGWDRTMLLAGSASEVRQYLKT